MRSWNRPAGQRLPTHYRVCPECESEQRPRPTTKRCPNCNHDPDRDVTPEQAQALDAVPECYDMGTPEVRTLVLALRDPGTPQERRKPATERLRQIGQPQAKGTAGTLEEETRSREIAGLRDRRPRGPD